jgi:hypothetical protein
MNTDFSSSAYARRLQSRAIASYNNYLMTTNNNGAPLLKCATANSDASLKNYINEGNLHCCSIVSLSLSSSAPSLPTQPGDGFIPTTWIDATGVNFSIGGESVSYGQGVWVSVGRDSTATIKTSIDNAVTWTNTDNQMTSGNNGEGVFGVATDGNGNWVVVGNKNTAAGAITILYSSDNGVTWNYNSSYDSGFNSVNGTTDRGWDVTYNNGIWMAVGHYSVGIGHERVIKIATIFDPVNGPNWANSPSGVALNAVFGVSNPAMCVAYGNGVWCVGGQDYNSPPKSSIVYSTNNGNTWTKATNSFRGMCQGIATDGNGNWVAVGYKSGADAKPIKISSDNGITWVDTSAPNTNLFSSGHSVTFRQGSSGGIWVAVGSGNSQTIIYSTDNGVSWSAAGSNRFTSGGNDIYFADNRWVAVGNGGSSSIKYSIA